MVTWQWQVFKCVGCIDSQGCLNLSSLSWMALDGERDVVGFGAAEDQSDSCQIDQDAAVWSARDWWRSR